MTGEAIFARLKNIKPIEGADNIVQANVFGETVFQRKWNDQSEIFEEVPFTFVYDTVKSVMGNLLTLNPRYITFELTEDCSVFFQAMTRDKNLYLELFFTDEVKEGVEALTTIYQNGEAILAYGGTIEDTLAKISSKVSTNDSKLGEEIRKELYDK